MLCFIALADRQCYNITWPYLQVDLFDCCNLLRVWCDLHISLHHNTPSDRESQTKRH
jgi:hypothetical protein